MIRALSLLVLLVAAPAYAQQSPELVAQRRALIDEAQEARRSNDHARAAETASRALAIESSPSLRRFVAEEQAAAGKLAAALGSAELCVREAERDTSARGNAAHATACRTLADSLRGRVAHLVVRVPADAPEDTAVTVAGAPFVRALWNGAALVDPGHVVVEATAHGRRAFHGETDVAEGARGEVAIVLQPDATAPPPDDVAHHDDTQQHVDVPPLDDTHQPPPPPPPDDTLDDVGAPLTIGLGVVGLGVAVGLTVARGDAIAEYQRCTDMACMPAAMAAHSRAESLDTQAGAMWIVGGVVAALGITWLVVDLVTAGSSSRSTASVSLTLTPSSVGVRGVF